MMEIKKVLLIGRGAVGTVMGKILMDSLQDQFAFGADTSRRARYEADPLQVNGEYPPFRYVSSPEEFGKADLILIATKYGALEKAMDLAEKFMHENTILMPCINGMLSEEDLRSRFPQQTTLRTIAQKMDANYHENQVEYTQKGELVFGADCPEQTEAVQAVSELFDRTGIPYVCCDDIVRRQWSKLMLNCGINQTCAAFDATYGDVIKNSDLYHIFVEAMKEVQRTAVAEGIVVTDEEVSQWVRDVDGLAKDSMPSMRQDVLAKRPTEEKLFSAYVIPLARKHGLSVPVLQMLKDKVDAIDAAL